MKISFSVILARQQPWQDLWFVKVMQQFKYWQIKLKENYIKQTQMKFEPVF